MSNSASGDPPPRAIRFHPDPQLAAWLVGHRRTIEREMKARLGDRAPSPGDPEAEALRRFRTFAASALQRGGAPPPALDGLRVEEGRIAPLLAAWTAAAVGCAGIRGRDLAGRLDALAGRFLIGLRQTAPARRLRGAPRTGRRAVMAAIDRVADGFLAIDVDSRRVADANPAAGALLHTSRDSILDSDAECFIPEAARQTWWTYLDAVAEGSDACRFSTSLRTREGDLVAVDVSLSRHVTRIRTLALLLFRPTEPA